MVKTIHFRGAPCVYRVEGKGKTLILVHGFIEEGSMWNRLLPQLKKRFKVIIPDLPGFGKSGLLEDVSMEAYADFLKAVADKEKLKSFILLGHSMGGYITLYFAEKHPGLLSSFGLINSHCFEDNADKKANRKKGIEFIRKYGSRPFVTELYNSIFHESYKKKNRPVIKKLIEQASTYSPVSLMKANAAMMNRLGKEDVLKKAKVPVLFIGGKDDQSAPLDLVLKQCAYPPVADIHLYAQSKHMCIYEHKKEATKAIIDFCSRKR